MKKPKAFPKKRLVGPNPVGQEWGPLEEEAREALGGQVGGGNLGEGVMNSLWRRWLTLAENEIIANLGLGGEEEKYVGRHEGLTLVQKACYRVDRVTGRGGVHPAGSSNEGVELQNRGGVKMLLGGKEAGLAFQ